MKLTWNQVSALSSQISKTFDKKNAKAILREKREFQQQMLPTARKDAAIFAQLSKEARKRFMPYGIKVINAQYFLSHNTLKSNFCTPCPGDIRDAIQVATIGAETVEELTAAVLKSLGVK